MKRIFTLSRTYMKGTNITYIHSLNKLHSISQSEELLSHTSSVWGQVRTMLTLPLRINRTKYHNDIQGITRPLYPHIIPTHCMHTHTHTHTHYNTPRLTIASPFFARSHTQLHTVPFTHRNHDVTQRYSQPPPPHTHTCFSNSSQLLVQVQ